MIYVRDLDTPDPVTELEKRVRLGIISVVDSKSQEFSLKHNGCPALVFPAEYV